MTSFLGGAAAAAGILADSQVRLQIQDKKGNTILLFDVSMEEEYKHEVTFTEFPVEGGANISDHIVVKPFELPFKGFISDTPLDNQRANLTEGAAVAASALLPPVGVAAAGLAYGLYQANSDDPSPSQAAYDTLVRLQKGDPAHGKPVEPFTIKCKMGTFRNMGIKSLSAPRNAQSGGGIEFNITFAQMDVVRPQKVDVGKFDNPGLAAGKAELGDQSPIPDGFTPGRVAGLNAVN